MPLHSQFIRTLTLLSAVFIGTIAHAQTPAPDLHDYNSLTQSLRAHGVEPTKINWATIQPLCLGLKTTAADQTPYNRCLYEKAVNSSQYQSDSKTCTQSARADYPDNLLSTQTQVNVTQNGGTTTSSTTNQAPLTIKDLEAKRHAGFLTCMSAKGWQDPNDPSRGRTGQ